MCGQREALLSFKAVTLPQCAVTMNEPNARARSVHRQFSLQSLLAVTVFVALASWAWRLSGFLGVVYLLAFISLIVANVGIAWRGAKLRCPILAGVLGGVLLWSVFAVVLGVRDGGVFSYAVAGVLAGLVCGGYARLKRLQVDNDGHKAMFLFFCIMLFVVIATVFSLAIFFAYWKPNFLAYRQPNFNRTISYGSDADDTHVVCSGGWASRNQHHSRAVAAFPQSTLIWKRHQWQMKLC